MYEDQERSVCILFSTSGLPFFEIANVIDRDKRSGKTAHKRASLYSSSECLLELLKLSELRKDLTPNQLGQSRPFDLMTSPPSTHYVMSAT
jgi:hypothetical protein